MVDYEKLNEILEICQLSKFIRSLNMGVKPLLGKEGLC